MRLRDDTNRTPNSKTVSLAFLPIEKGGILMLETVEADVKNKIGELVELTYKGDQEAIEKLIKIKKELGGN